MLTGIRKALCIGNNAYQEGKALNCAVNDARAIGNVLNNLGFITEIKFDLTKKEMIDAVEGLFNLSQIPEAIVVYYAGHGCEIGGENVLVPVDVDFGLEPNTVRQNSYQLQEIIRHYSYFPECKKILILDACRSNITNERDSRINGFSPISSPRNTLIAFSTSPGERAKEDFESGHGLFTGILLEKISLPRVSVETMFKQVRVELMSKCLQKSPENVPQISWEHTSLVDEFYFNPNTVFEGTEYSDDAYHDNRFKDFASDNTRFIIEGLKSHDFNKQNLSCERLRSLDFINSSCQDDLFVIGRGLYQSSDNSHYNFFSHECFLFISDFVKENIPKEAKTHLLNGIAYEIYFDKDNKFRSVPKTSRLEIVLNLLELDMFWESRSFIASKLTALSDCVTYIPGSKDVKTFQIETTEINNHLFLVSAKLGSRYVYRWRNETECWGERTSVSSLKKYIGERVCAFESNIFLSPINNPIFFDDPYREIYINNPATFNRFL